MKRLSIVVTIAMSALTMCFGQDQVKVPPEEPPKLEIPEITIVGKKAITLPFARKGEIYDVDLYEAPAADSSLLGNPPSMSLLAGRLPRHENHDQPWRSSAEGALGSFGSGHLKAYLDYKGDAWGVSANAGFGSSNGHVENSSSSQFNAGASLHSIVSTDNRILKSFRTEAGMTFSRDEYGMFGIPGASVRRTHSIVGLKANMGTLNRTGGILDIDFAANFNSLKDATPAGDSSITVVSPRVSAAYALPLKRITVSTSIAYSSSGLTYQHPVQSPSVTEFNLGASWKMGNRWQFEAGGTMNSGSDMKGNDLTLVMPFASAECAIDSSMRAHFWLRPEMSFTAYGGQLTTIPYLSREVELQPERQPVAFGSSFDFRDEMLTVIVSGSFAHYSTKGIVIAQGGGIRLEYPEASIVTLGVQGSLTQWRRARMDFSGTITSAHEPGSETQLPMMPVTRLTAREEIKFELPFSVWGSVEYRSAKNVDRDGVQKLPGVLIANCGAYATIAHRLVLGAEITNLFNVEYEWWKEYPAPRIGFDVSAKVNIQ